MYGYFSAGYGKLNHIFFRKHKYINKNNIKSVKKKCKKLQSQVEYNIVIFQYFLSLFCSKHVKNNSPSNLVTSEYWQFNHRRNNKHEISIFPNAHSICSTITLRINWTQTYLKNAEFIYKLKLLHETLISYAVKHIKILHIPTCIIILLVQAKAYRFLSIPFTTHTTTTAWPNHSIFSNINTSWNLNRCMQLIQAHIYIYNRELNILGILVAKIRFQSKSRVFK